MKKQWMGENDGNNQNTQDKDWCTHITLPLTVWKQVSCTQTVIPRLVEEGIIMIIINKQNASNPKPSSI